MGAFSCGKWRSSCASGTLCGSVGSEKGPHGVVCLRKRKTGVAGCGKGVCFVWGLGFLRKSMEFALISSHFMAYLVGQRRLTEVCMDKAPQASFGMVRTTKEEFESLEKSAWWMHEARLDRRPFYASFQGLFSLFQGLDRGLFHPYSMDFQWIFIPFPPPSVLAPPVFHAFPIHLPSS